MQKNAGQERVIAGHGPRETEHLLVEALRGLVDQGCAEPSLLRQPIRIVVPSQTLRHDLAVVFVRRLGGAALGVTVQTLGAFAQDILRRTSPPPPTSEVLFEVLVRREASAEPVLAERLNRFDDGLGLAAASARDLLSAGFEPEQLPALEVRAAAMEVPEARERTLALLRVADRTRRAMAAAGFGRFNDRYSLAARALRANPSILLARAVLVHGFSDAPGCTAELLRPLYETKDAVLVFDLPQDPSSPREVDSGAAFVQGFARRLGLDVNLGSPPAREIGAPLSLWAKKSCRGAKILLSPLPEPG
jgi:hypothetical protein